jgi:hypothetical protein
LLSIRDSAFPEESVQRFKVPLNPLPGFLLDGIKLRPDVIIIDIAILLQDQGPQLSPISWSWLEPPEPFPGSSSQIKLSDLEQLVCIEVSHLSDHGKSFSPIADILVLTPPEQLVHALWTSHSADARRLQRKMHKNLHTQNFQTDSSITRFRLQKHTSQQQQNFDWTSLCTVLSKHKSKQKETNMHLISASSVLVSKSKTIVTRIIHRIQLELPHGSVSRVVSQLEQWKTFVHQWTPVETSTLLLAFARLSN